MMEIKRIISMRVIWKKEKNKNRSRSRNRNRSRSKNRENRLSKTVLYLKNKKNRKVQI